MPLLFGTQKRKGTTAAERQAARKEKGALRRAGISPFSALFKGRKALLPKDLIDSLDEGGDGQTAEEIAAAMIAAMGGSGSDSGGAGRRSLADELTLMREQARLSAETPRQVADRKLKEQLERNIIFDKAAADKLQAQLDRNLIRDQEIRATRERQREQHRAMVAERNRLKAQRQATFVEMMGRDPVRAVLFAMGIGPEADRFNTQMKSIGATVKPLRGAAKSEKRTESALGKLLGGERKIDLGERGVTGLGTAIGAARSFQQADVTGQGLLTSAFGVGSTARGQQPGLTPEAMLEQIQQVTPTGIL
jgi:hypothetical protein